MSKRYVETPFGRMLICADSTGISELRLHYSGAEHDEAELLLQAEKELEEYFAGRRKYFSVPLSMNGTDFQMRVWSALREIPYGEVCTYGQIAERIGCAGGARAVGMANHVNPIPVIVPCHRVIGGNGKLIGYGGGLDMKIGLLRLEGYNGKT